MCEYCEKGKEIRSCNFCGGAKAIILVSDDCTILDIGGDENKFQLFKKIYRPRFDIDYCPMCR